MMRVGSGGFKALRGFINSWLEEGTLDAAKRISSSTDNPLIGIISIPIHGILSFLFKERKLMDKESKGFRKKFTLSMSNLWSGVGKMFTSGVGAFARIAGLAITSLPLLIGVAVVGAIIGIAYLIFTYWKDIKEAFTKYVVDPIVELFHSIVDSVKGIFTGIGDIVEKAVRALPFVMGDAILGQSVSGIPTGAAIDGTPIMTESGKINKNIETMIAPQNKELQDSMRMLNEAMARFQPAPVQQISPPPASNIDDLGTLMYSQ